MGVRKKGRRKLNVGDRAFVWYVFEDHDSPDMVLHVSSDDKLFVVRYHLQQLNEPILIVIGREFAGPSTYGGVWRRVRCPRWEAPSVVTPATVRRLIEWCLSSGEPRIEIDWRGVATQG